MFIEGAKVFIVFIAYLIIPVMVIIFLALLSLGVTPSYIGLSFPSMFINPWNLIVSVIWSDFLNFMAILYDYFLPGEIFAFIYAVIVLPLFK